LRRDRDGASDCLTLVDQICGNGLNNAVVMAKWMCDESTARAHLREHGGMLV
jgi:hypothetical protein